MRTSDDVPVKLMHLTRRRLQVTGNRQAVKSLSLTSPEKGALLRKYLWQVIVNGPTPDIVKLRKMPSAVKIFTKIIRRLVTAAAVGGGDRMPTRVCAAVDKALASNMTH